MKPKAERHQAIARHELINKLSIIIGNCDLLLERSEQGTESTRRLATIKDLAKSITDKLVQQPAETDQKARKTESRKAS